MKLTIAVLSVAALFLMGCSDDATQEAAHDAPVEAEAHDAMDKADGMMEEAEGAAEEMMEKAEGAADEMMEEAEGAADEMMEEAEGAAGEMMEEKGGLSPLEAVKEEAAEMIDK